MMGLTEFLLARIAEDQHYAELASADSDNGGRWRSRMWDGQDQVVGADVEVGVEGDDMVCVFPDLDMPRDHVARWDPARVLAECEAKRRIVELCNGADMPNPRSDYSAGWVTVGYFVLQSLAQPYADHPDYDPEWKP